MRCAREQGARTGDAASTCVEVRMRRERSLVVAVAFMCRGTARSTGSSDASGQMHLRIARVICTCHISSFIYVTHNTYAQYTPLTDILKVVHWQKLFMARQCHCRSDNDQCHCFESLSSLAGTLINSYTEQLILKHIPQYV